MNVDAWKATIITSAEVVIATLTGVFLLKEEINLIGYFGIAIMLISIHLMNINPIKSKEVTEKHVLSELSAEPNEQVWLAVVFVP